MPERLYNKYLDLLTAFPFGCNSGVAPLLLPKEQLSFSINSTVRGGYATDRPPVQKLTLNFSNDAALQTAVRKGFFQGSQTYRPDFGPSQIIAQISGRLFRFIEVGASWTVDEITIPGDPNDATTNQVWMWQAEKWLIISDGTAKLPIFYDGVSCRRSYGPSVVLANVTAAAPAGPNAVGTVITATLTAPYTGPFDVPVSFNGALYQPVSNPGGDYNISLTNLSDTAGNNIPSGTPIVVDPNFIGKTRFAACSNFDPTIPVHITSVAGVLVGDQVSIAVSLPGPVPPPAVNVFTVASIDVTNKIIRLNKGVFGAFNICYAANVPVYFAVNRGPQVIIGNTTSNFISPAIGGSVSTTIDQAYTGAAGQTVLIGTEQYSITSPPAVPGLTLYLINLNDNAAIGTLPMDISSVPEIPACRMGAYGLGQNWFSAVDGLSFGMSDLVGSSSGTPANNYRDAVLKTTDLQVTGYFPLPNAGEIITSMTFVATLDQALGQGPLQVGVASGMFSVKAPFTLIDFQGTTLTEALANPILTKSMIGFGPIAQNSTIASNSDTIFRSVEGIGSLILARRAFSDLGGNTPISREMTRTIQNDNQSLLSYSSAIVFDNRLRMTCAPNVSGMGVFHMGELVLNYDLLSSLRGKAQPVWDGLWTGLNILQYMQGMFGPVSRAFAFSANLTDTQIELYELLPTGNQHFDNGDGRIRWVLETPVLFGPSVKVLTEMVRLIDGEMYVSDVNGKVDFLIEYRPLFYPCWRYWHSFSICADMNDDNAQEQVRYALGFGEPNPKDCDPINNQSFRDAVGFQLRLTIAGHCKIWGIKVLGEQQPNPKFTPPICTPLCLDLPSPEPDIIPPTPPIVQFGNEVVYFVHECSEGAELIYEGTLPPWITLDADNSRLVALPGVYFASTQESANALAQAALDEFGNAALADDSLSCLDPEAFSNEEVYFVHECETGTLTYDGELPAWITLDVGNSRLVGAAGTYFGPTQEAANATAQTAIDDFGTEALDTDALACVSESACAGGFTDRFRIAGYVDGSFTMCEFQEASTDPVWDGSFATKQTFGEICRFYNNETFRVNDAGSPPFRLQINNFSPGFWTMTLETVSFGIPYLFWKGKLAGDSPVGVYNWVDGCSTTTLTVTVEQYTP